MTPISINVTTESMARRLAENGYLTLEDCAQAGTGNLIRVKSLGYRTLSNLKRACKRHGVDWVKDEKEKSLLATLKKNLMETYKISEREADVCCEIYFTEGWSPR